MFTLNNLESAGLLRKPDTKLTYPSIKKALNLFNDKINESNPNDVSYTYSG